MRCPRPLTALSGAWKTSLALLGALAISGEAHAQNVAVLYAVPDPNYATDVINKLQQTRLLGNVDSFNVATGTPTAAELGRWDAVLVFNDAGFADSTTLGNRLADYVDQGGGVVEMVFANTTSIPLGGRFDTGNYEAIEGQTQVQGIVRTMNPLVPNDPLLNGVRTFNAGISSYVAGNATAVRGARLVAEYDDGNDMAAYWTPRGTGVVVGLNYYPPSSDARGDFWDASTDGDILMANALLLASGQGGGAPQFRDLDLTFLWFCPGWLTFGVANATPLGQVALVTGEAGGTSTIPRGVCAGTSLSVGRPQLLSTFRADRFGQVQTQFYGVPDLCGLPVQVVDLTTCSPSELLAVPTRP
jgi:hypothetical protein